MSCYRGTGTSPTSRGPPSRHPVRRELGDVPDRDARPLGAQAVRRRSGHAEPQARGRLVGRRRRLLRRQLRATATAASTSTRPGVVLRPRHRDGDPEDDLRGNPDPDVDTRQLRRPRQHDASPRTAALSAEHGEGVQHLVGVTEGKSYRWPATTSTTASSPDRLQPRRQGAVRQHPVTRLRPSDHRALGAAAREVAEPSAAARRRRHGGGAAARPADTDRDGIAAHVPKASLRRQAHEVQREGRRHPWGGRRRTPPSC